MSKFIHDQAAGLRRIMSTPAPRIVSILSANQGHDNARLMTNLAVSMLQQGNKPMVIHASKTSSETFYGINALPTLLNTVSKDGNFNSAIYLSNYGFSITKLMQKSELAESVQANLDKKLSLIINQLSHQYDVLLVDASLNQADLLPVSRLNEGEILIQLNRSSASIKEAYALIKKIYNQLGTRSFGIIVDDATTDQAKIVFNNISNVARNYMSLQLEFFGAIPSDEYVSKASQLGRSVIEAFPLAKASTAFKEIARKLDEQKTALTPLKQAVFN